MGHRTHFWTSDEAQPGCVKFADLDQDDRALLSAGGWSVPILWTMCFSGKDVNVLAARADDDDPESSPWGASCDTTLADAIRRVERRMPSLQAIVAPESRAVGELFLAKLRESTRSHVHMEVTLLLENEDDPGDGRWKNYWAGLLEGLDQPVRKVRTGLSRRLLGLGLPSGWKYLCLWSVSNGSLNQITAATLESHVLTGAGIPELCLWSA